VCRWPAFQIGLKRGDIRRAEQSCGRRCRGICEVARSHLLGRGRMLACTTRWHAHPHEIRFIRPSRKALKSPTRLHCRQVCRGFEIWGGRSSSVQYRGRFGPLRRPLKRQPCSPFGSCAVHGGSANEAKASIRLHLSLAGHGSKVYPRPSSTPDHSSFLRRATRHRLWGERPPLQLTLRIAACSLPLARPRLNTHLRDPRQPAS
jgi:hypothetical protein